MRVALCVLAVAMAAQAARAVELELPATARQLIARDTVEDRFYLPTAPFDGTQLPTKLIEGDVVRSAWRVDVAGLTPLQMIRPLRAQLEEEGFRIVLDCAAAACGGYDFRFAAEVLPAPNMYVNIRNFHVVTALRGEAEAVMVLTSASSGASFVQIIQAGEGVTRREVQTTAAVPLPAAPAPAPVRGSLAETLLRDGHAVLEGLDFESGTTELGSGPIAALQELASVLQAQPELRVALVGHTDNVGTLQGNIALSRSRAAAVRAQLIAQWGIAADRLEAQGMGFLAPHTTNATDAGRDINRRVEVIVLAR